MITVYGQIDDEPIMVRHVTIYFFLHSWGRFAPHILNARESTPFIVGNRKVWVE